MNLPTTIPTARPDAAVGRRFRGRASHALLVVLAAMFATLGVAVTSGSQPASAASCSPYCTGASPRGTNCDSDGRTLKSLRMTDPANGAEIGWAYLRYSPSCGTEWVTVTYASGYFPRPSVWNQNQSGTDQYTAGDAPYQGKVWTKMIADMRYRAGCGGVQMYRGVSGGNGYVGWYYLGCA